ncbi:hypothetical protein [Burkholderia sp. Ax-1724]|uniref:hypothetical protein n=1 Tax=Burkholderia sp. Ax-1724 TaxID=2608336 RepID=UPI0014206535|nr:hypothetical protein [Burkholderia sp. Ax-1724]NIF52289.1 hypothetical protein [Burkholderia sp. Ax-1724]
MGKTVVSISGNQFHINGRPTWEGRSWNGNRIEGLLFNSRMANAIADDENPTTRGVWAYADGPWDPDRNTAEFCAALADYKTHGLDAVCINLQGGSPRGYSPIQPWIISAFESDGSLKEPWMKRLEKVLQATDELGMVVVLGLFYGASTRLFADEAAVVRAVDNTVDWLAKHTANHVLLEIGNEIDNKVFHQPVIEVARCHELIERAKSRSEGKFNTPAKRLLVSASILNPHTVADNIIGASDFLLVHGNHVTGLEGWQQSNPDGIRLQLLRTKASPAYRGQPIFYNEDDHFDFDKPDNHLVAAVEGYAGWGFFDYRGARESMACGFQSLPVDWRIGSERKKGFFSKLKEITGGKA